MINSCWRINGNEYGNEDRGGLNCLGNVFVNIYGKIDENIKGNNLDNDFVFWV